MKSKILSIDAWKDIEGGWNWNAWYDTGVEYEHDNIETNRKILKKMREYDLLAENSKGKVSVEDDGYQYIVADRRTREPLFAIVYGDNYY